MIKTSGALDLVTFDFGIAELEANCLNVVPTSGLRQVSDVRILRQGFGVLLAASPSSFGGPGGQGGKMVDESYQEWMQTKRKFTEDEILSLQTD